MKTRIATAALTVMFLSAGAFAGNDRPVVQPLGAHNTNMTVISKNRSWPVRGLITVEACKLARCIDI
jgi:outer membrane lipoprotein-sorting protein